METVGLDPFDEGKCVIAYVTSTSAGGSSFKTPSEVITNSPYFEVWSTYLAILYSVKIPFDKHEGPIR